MNGLGVAFLAIAGTLILALPRRLAALPLIASALYMTGGQVLEIGSANFTVPRLLVTLGFVRVLFRGEHLLDGLHTVDKVILLWAAVLLGMSTFHKDHRDVLIAPVVSEKSYGLLDVNKYTFLVHPDANKTEIKIAVEKVFNVKVTSVNTLNRQGKTRRTRFGMGKRANTKRAIVSLAEGQRIDIFGGPVS